MDAALRTRVEKIPNVTSFNHGGDTPWRCATQEAENLFHSDVGVWAGSHHHAPGATSPTKTNDQSMWLSECFDGERAHRGTLHRPRYLRYAADAAAHNCSVYRVMFTMCMAALECVLMCSSLAMLHSVEWLCPTPACLTGNTHIHFAHL